MSQNRSHGGRLHKRAASGFRGYPVATIAFYGPDNNHASKVAVGIVLQEGAEASYLEKWWSEDNDVRNDPLIGRGILMFIDHHHAKTVIMTDRIIGCPHEEGVDYPKGAACPRCPYWANRDRWTGELLR